jgi:hypothetical protein
MFHKGQHNIEFDKTFLEDIKNKRNNFLKYKNEIISEDIEKKEVKFKELTI